MKPNRFTIDRETRRRLAVQRVNEGWSQKDVAAFLGVHAVTVSEWVQVVVVAPTPEDPKVGLGVQPGLAAVRRRQR